MYYAESGGDGAGSKRLGALVYATSHLARILEAGELEQRVEALEAQLEERDAKA